MEEFEGADDTCIEENSELSGSDGDRVVGEFVGVTSEGLDGSEDSAKSWLLWVASGELTVSKRLSMLSSGMTILCRINARSSS